MVSLSVARHFRIQFDFLYFFFCIFRLFIYFRRPYGRIASILCETRRSLPLGPVDRCHLRTPSATSMQISVCLLCPWERARVFHAHMCSDRPLKRPPKWHHYFAKLYALREMAEKKSTIFVCSMALRPQNRTRCVCVFVLTNSQWFAVQADILLATSILTANAHASLSSWVAVPEHEILILTRSHFWMAAAYRRKNRKQIQMSTSMPLNSITPPQLPRFNAFRFDVSHPLTFDNTCATSDVRNGSPLQEVLIWLLRLASQAVRTKYRLFFPQFYRTHSISLIHDLFNSHFIRNRIQKIIKSMATKYSYAVPKSIPIRALNDARAHSVLCRCTPIYRLNFYMHSKLCRSDKRLNTNDGGKMKTKLRRRGKILVRVTYVKWSMVFAWMKSMCVNCTGNECKVAKSHARVCRRRRRCHFILDCIDRDEYSMFESQADNKLAC